MFVVLVMQKNDDVFFFKQKTAYEMLRSLVGSERCIRGRECDIQDHNLTHLPFRSWCRHCVRGRGNELPHKKLQDEPGMIELHADLCFLGDENDPGNTVPVFVMRERTTRMTLAAVVPSKSTNAYITKRIVAFMKEIGVVHGDVL